MKDSSIKPVEEAIKLVRGDKKRNFNQSIDLIVNLKSIDLKKPENKFTKTVILPHGRGKDVDICIIANNGQIKKADIEDFERNKSAAKKLVRRYEFFLCEAPLMPLVGKILGRYLGPKGKMPDILPPGGNPDAKINELKKSIRIKVRDTPTIQVIIGVENMSDDQIKENAARVLEEIKKAMPAKAQIRNAYIKLTMGKPVRIGV
jgi:large subunit ribosomal protein L1